MSEKDFIIPNLDPQNHVLLDVIRATVQAALIAQYDAIMASVGQVNETIPVDVYEIRAEFVAAIAKHDPRKGAE